MNFQAVSAALLLFLGGSVQAFQAATTTTRTTTPVEVSASTSSSSTTRHQEHEFWRKTRTHQEVQAHVTACLADIPDYYEQRQSTSSSQVHVLSAEPPLVLIRDFLSNDMCQDLIQTAKDTGGMAQSRTGSEQNLSKSRTSSTVWLTDEDATDPSRLIASKVSSITGLPADFQENLQIARYEPGQAFNLHTDHQDSFNELERRGRLATFLIYLDTPAVGGATYFPGVNDEACGTDVFVPPISGTAVFFFNTVEKPGCVNYDAEMFLNTDLRMRHAGLPVESGEKWICNRWVHPIGFGAGVQGLRE